MFKVPRWFVFTARYGLIPYIQQITFGLQTTVVESVYSAVRTDSFIQQITFGLQITVVESVYSAVCTDFLHKADYVWFLSSRDGKCLQRCTDWFLIYSRLCLVFKKFKQNFVPTDWTPCIKIYKRNYTHYIHTNPLLTIHKQTNRFSKRD